MRLFWLGLLVVFWFRKNFQTLVILWFLFVYSPIKLSKRRIKFDQHFPITLHQAVHTMRGCHPRRSSPPLRPFVCNSGSSFDRRLLHAYDWLYERRCHPSPVGRAFDFIACHSAIATHVATTMSAFAPRPRTHTRQSFRLLCTYTRGSDCLCS